MDAHCILLMLGEFRYLKQKFLNGIFLLQETHSSADIKQVWKIEWNGDIFFSHGPTNSCGVAILIYPGIDLDIQVLQKDEHGRVLAIT